MISVRASENKNVPLATNEGGRHRDAAGPRLVVPGDTAGGRYITKVNRVFLEKPAAVIPIPRGIELYEDPLGRRKPRGINSVIDTCV